MVYRFMRVFLTKQTEDDFISFQTLSELFGPVVLPRDESQKMALKAAAKSLTSAALALPAAPKAKSSPGKHTRRNARMCIPVGIPGVAPPCAKHKGGRSGSISVDVGSKLVEPGVVILLLSSQPGLKIAYQLRGTRWVISIWKQVLEKTNDD